MSDSGARSWAAASIAGLSLRLNNTDVSVSGVLPESFSGPAGMYAPDVWLPLDEIALFGTSPKLQARDTRWLFFLGRLHPESSVAEVQGQLETAAAGMATDWPDSHRDRGARFRMLSERNSELRGIATGAAIGMGLIGLVLLLACFNVTNLLLARAVERERDMGIRTALGARPGRLMRLVVIEGFVIAALSGVAALVLAWWTQSLVATFAMPIEQPQHIDLTPDLNVVAFITVLVVIAGVLPGLWPALSAARVDVLRVLGSQGGNSAGGRPSPMRRWLVGAQIAGSTAFLAIAALFIQSLGRIVEMDLGFDRDRLVIAEFEPASSGYGPDAAERYVNELLARVRALPGVSGAAVIDRAPFFIGFERVTPVWPDGGVCESGSCPRIATLAAGPGYFRTMGISLVAGREFQPVQGAAEVVINQPFARQQWPDGRGLGETLRLGDRGAAVIVVGITAAHSTRGLNWERPTLYVPLAREHYTDGLTVVARTASEATPLVRPVMAAGEDVDPKVALLSVKTMQQRMAVQTWPFRTLCADVLDLRPAGAHPRDGGTCRRGDSRGQPTPAGVRRARLDRRNATRPRGGCDAKQRRAPAARSRRSARCSRPSVARLVQVVFLGVNVLNPLTYLAVALLECAIVLVACIGPALRASHVDPLVALRAE